MPRAETSPDAQPTVLVYRDLLGLPSETFVVAQAATLARYRPVFLCSRLAGHLRAEGDTIAINSGTLGYLREASWKLVGSAPRLTERIESVNARLLHAHFLFDGARAMRLARRAALPLVVTAHGIDATVDFQSMKKSFSNARFYANNAEQLSRQATTFVAVSRFIRGRLIERGVPENKISVHYIGVDCETFKSSNRTRDTTVLFVGRLVPKKNCSDLIRAMSLVRSAIPEARLVIIGDGPERGALVALAASLRVEAMFLGTQAPAEVRRWMNVARVFCVPSVRADNGDSEGFGLVFAEAQAMGVPVASYFHGGVPEAVEHGETGLLAVEKDWRTLASNLSRLLVDNDLWYHMSVAGRKRVVTHFNLRLQTPLLEGIYEEAIKNGPSNRR